MMNDKSCRLDRGWPEVSGTDTPQESPPPPSPRPPDDCPYCGMPSPKETGGGPLTPHGEAIAAGDGTLHGAIDYWQEQAFKMAAGQCCVKSGGLMADDHGNAYCDMQRQRDELRGRLRVMTNIMGDALSVLNTIQGEESDEETRLDSLRAKMAGAIDSVLRTEKASIYKEKT